MMSVAIPLILIVVAFFFIFRKKEGVEIPEDIVIPEKWKTLLNNEVEFYRQLNESDKERFETDCYKFLFVVKVIGVKGVEVDLRDRLLVASSAVIPLFRFPEWTYHNISEVILYPSAFDRGFELNNPDEVITGMVGSGVMDGKMILSKPALIYGYQNSNDKSNVGIHEFVHLFDKEDGVIDGVPKGLEDKIFSLPWLDLVKVNIIEIERGTSDIKPYGATSHEEFFAVASEYFFESPHLLKKKHPRLYNTLTKVFNHDLAETYQKKKKPAKRKPKRNERCVCGSGLKYKNCCTLS